MTGWRGRDGAASYALVGGLVAEGVSLLGTRISMIAISWFVLPTTGSATQTGLVAAAEITPPVLLKAPGGPLLADARRRHPRRARRDRAGALPGVPVAGAAYFITTMAPTRVPSSRQMDRAPAADARTSVTPSATPPA